MTTDGLGNTGIGGPLSDSDSVGITVSAVADAPTAAAAAFTVESNMKIVGLALPLSSATDPDTGDGYTATFSVHDVVTDTCPASGGTISTSTRRRAPSTYDPPANQTGTCSLKYRVDDSGNSTR